MSSSQLTQQLAHATGELVTAAAAEMERSLPWYRELGAQERSWVGQVAQAGIQEFIDWFADGKDTSALTSNVFGAAPRELARAITFEQTVDLVRTTISVVEQSIEHFTLDGDRAPLREAILRYSREIAFSAAEVYARAAEARGAWDARLEALVIDALIRDDVSNEILSQASALGWSSTGAALVMAGAPPEIDAEASLSVMRRAAHGHALELLTGTQGSVMITVVGGPGVESGHAHRLMTPYFGPGPVVVGDVISGLHEIGSSARACVSGFHAASSWPTATRPVPISELLPERAILGEQAARADLIDNIFQPLAQESVLIETLTAYFDNSHSLEATGRILFVHPNTVRYRLKRIAQITGYDPTHSREAFALHIALVCGLGPHI